MPRARREVFGDIVAPFAVCSTAVAHEAAQKSAFRRPRNSRASSSARTLGVGRFGFGSTYDYAEQQRKPGKHLVGIGIVVLMHVLLGWALVSGLARKVVEVIKNPIETKIIEEVKPPPPPPENLPPPPPKLAPPPPSFVPPPEVTVAPPPTPAPAITTPPSRRRRRR